MSKTENTLHKNTVGDGTEQPGQVVRDIVYHRHPDTRIKLMNALPTISLINEDFREEC